MSIYESKPRKTYAVGATAQAAFAVPFVFWAASDIRVYVDDVRLTSGYTVTGGNGAGGTVTLATPVSNTTVAVVRRLKIERTTDFPNAGPLKTPAVNRQFDQHTAILQQLDDDNARALTLPESDDALGSPLPPLSRRANRILGFDAAGKPIVSTISIQQLDALTLAAMQAGKVAEVIEPFEADGTTSTITTTAPLVAAAQVTLLIGGIVQRPESGAYTVSGTTITLAEPPPAGVVVGGFVGYATEVAGDALTAMQGTTPAADRLPYFTGEASATTTALTAFARSLLGGVDAATIRALLGALATNGDGSSVQVKPSGGAVWLPIAALFAAWWTVKHSGAAGNGTADDTAAIQAAVSRGGAVHLPAGAYKVTAPIAIPANTTLWGAGPDAVTIIDATGTGDVFRIGDGVTLTQNAFVHGLSIAAPAPKSAGAAVVFNLTQHCGARNLRLTNPYRGLVLQNTSIFDGTDVKAIHPVDVGALITGTSGNEHRLTGVRADGDPAAQAAAAIRIEHTGQTWLIACGSTYCTDGMVMAPASGQTVEHVTTQACMWDTAAGSGIRIEPALGGKVRRSKFDVDWTATFGLFGVWTTGAGTVSDLEFVAPRACNCGRNGFYFQNGSDIRVNGGTVAGNSTSAIGTYDGIRIGAATSGITLDGVLSGPTAEFANYHRYNVYVEAGATGFSINDCDLRGGVSGTISDQSGNVPKMIWGNLPDSILNYTSGTLMRWQIGTTVTLTQVAATGHLAGNVGSVEIGIKDGGSTAGRFGIYNTHDGTYSSQDFRVHTGQGGVSDVAERWRMRPDGSAWMSGNSQQVFRPTGIGVDRAYTVATMPSASPANQRIYVSDRSKPAWSDGTNWRFADGTTVS